MSLQSVHPSYSGFVQDWVLMRDSNAGERQMKSKDLSYLPATPAQIIDGMNSGKTGRINYDSYKERAVFHDFVSDAVKTYMGLLHKKPANFQLPAGMEGMLTKATNTGESLQSLLRRITEEQLITGRLGLLLDLPVNPDQSNPTPYITIYCAEAIRNWDESDDYEGVNSLKLVVLDETAYERNSDFEWICAEKYRVLALGEVGVSTGEVDSQQNRYSTGTFNIHKGETFNQADMIEPLIRGTGLDQIPFVFVNAMDTASNPDRPPLIGLGRLSLAIYRGEADYRQHLFFQGQDTLVVKGGTVEDGALRTGSGARIDVDVTGDAKYIGISSQGLPEVRMSLENDKQRADSKAGSLSTKPTGQKESGEALNIRQAGQTANLTSIALASAAGLEKILKIAAVWMGKDPNKVVVTPNMQFGEIEFEGKSILDLMSARTMGAPLSKQSIHAIAVEKGLTKISYEEEIDLIEQEDAPSLTTIPLVTKE